MSNAPATDRVSAAQALEALESMDDLCKMPYSIDPIGPYKVLQRYIEQQILNDAKASVDAFTREMEKHRVDTPVGTPTGPTPAPFTFTQVGAGKLGYAAQTTNLPVTKGDMIVGTMTVNAQNMADVLDRGAVDMTGSMIAKVDYRDITLTPDPMYYSGLKCNCAWCTENAKMLKLLEG